MDEPIEEPVMVLDLDLGEYVLDEAACVRKLDGAIERDEISRAAAESLLRKWTDGRGQRRSRKRTGLL